MDLKCKDSDDDDDYKNNSDTTYRIRVFSKFYFNNFETMQIILTMMCRLREITTISMHR